MVRSRVADLSSRNRRAVRTDDYYDVYWSDQGFNPPGMITPTLHKLLQTYVPEGASCLDVGCGDGQSVGAWAREHGRQYVGVDVSANAVARARSAGLDARTIEDPSALPFESDAFDVVTCIEVFEHLLVPQLVAADILRVLRPAGVLIATVPNVAYWRRRLDLALLGRWNPLGDDLSVEQPWRDPHVRFFNPGALRRMLTSVGFSSVHIGGHSGAFIRDLPFMRRFVELDSSPLYKRLEVRAPSLFAYGLHAIATKSVKPSATEVVRRGMH